MDTRNFSTISLPLVLALSGACGPPQASEECVPIDEHLGTNVHWCDGIFLPKNDADLRWGGKPATLGFAVCLPPQTDGSCQVCSRAEVTSDVAVRMTEILAEYEPECQLEHWELGCMRTEERGKQLGWGPGGSHYCCFEVAVWGPGCEESP